LRLVASNRRSQLQNREEAIERLQQVVAAALIIPRRRIATKPSRGSKEARLVSKKVRSRTKRLRGPIKPDE
jgi:ribosome-associated protein